MKFLVVVLALSGLCAAEPEADPPLLLPAAGPSPYFGYSPLVYNAAPLALPLAAPLPLVPAGRLLTPHDCVTPGGCNARLLLEAGLAGRKKRDADADPALLYSGLLPYAYNDFAYAPYNYNYNLGYNYAPAPLVAAPAPLVVPEPVLVHREPVVVPVVHDHTRPVTYTHIGAHPVQPTTVLETDRRISRALL